LLWGEFLSLSCEPSMIHYRATGPKAVGQLNMDWNFQVYELKWNISLYRLIIPGICYGPGKLTTTTPRILLSFTWRLWYKFLGFLRPMKITWQSWKRTIPILFYLTSERKHV
jgi:hypothetical protein